MFLWLSWQGYTMKRCDVLYLLCCMQVLSGFMLTQSFQDTETAVLAIVGPCSEELQTLTRLILYGTMHPTSAIRSMWNSYMVILLASICLITPVCSTHHTGHVHAFTSASPTCKRLPPNSASNPHKTGVQYIICFDVKATGIGVLPLDFFHECCQYESHAVTVCNLCHARLSEKRCLTLAGMWEAILDASFTLDIILNFRTSYMRGKKLVTRPTDIAINYLQVFQDIAASP